MRVAPARNRTAARRVRAAVVTVLLGGFVALAGACSEGAAPSAAGDPAAAPTGPSARAGESSGAAAAPTGGAPLPPGVSAGIARMLDRRALAHVTGDEAGYASTVADVAGPDGAAQLAAFAAARALGVSFLEVGVPAVEPVVGVEGRWRVEADLRYRLGGLDRGDRVARVRYVVEGPGSASASGSGWRVVSQGPVGPGASVPWVAMPELQVRRGEHAVVAGTVSAHRLAEHVGVVDRALPPLRRQWAGAPDRVLVLAPATPDEADALLGRSSGAGVAPVAATTEGPTGPAGTATGDRVVLDPSAHARLTPSGRDVVLTHELAHVAVRASVPGRPARWLAEGYADHVGYTRADVPAKRLLEPLVGRVRADGAPSRLPTADDLDPAHGDLEVAYLAAWQAAELVAAEHGENALRRLVVAGSSRGSDADAEAQTDAALASVLGTTRDELTAAWRQRLAALTR
ncbi:hypothetical protein GCM10023168_20330 [Fodinibacter luteus]|uniref:Peptidase MA superfamily protein n=1 Tax=Fodinibacter luteus TaxID=552064 RepID=A0ABP8KFH8_9MICO